MIISCTESFKIRYRIFQLRLVLRQARRAGHRQRRRQPLFLAPRSVPPPAACRDPQPRHSPCFGLAEVPRVERFDGPATESFESFTLNSVEIRSEFRSFFRNSSEILNILKNPHYFLGFSAKFRENFIRIGVKFDENR